MVSESGVPTSGGFVGGTANSVRASRQGGGEKRWER